MNLVTFKIFLNLCSCVHLHAMVCMWSSEDSWWVSALSFYRMGPKDWTQTVRIGEAPLPFADPGFMTFLSLIGCLPSSKRECFNLEERAIQQ